MKLLEVPLSGTVFCVIDGLDECDKDSQNWIVKKVARLAVGESKIGQSDLRPLRLMIVSRFVLGLNELPTVNLDPDHDDQVEGDIGRFISVRVH